MSQSQNIPFLDLVTPHVELEQRANGGLPKGITRGWFYRRRDGGGLREGIRLLLPS